MISDEDYERIDAQDAMHDLDDATVEDTVRCHLCGASWALGGNDGLLVELPTAREGSVAFDAGGTLSVCCDCAQAVTLEYIKACHEAGICVHGEAQGKQCAECQK